MTTLLKNASRQECVFTDEGVTFYGVKQEVYMPYGCLDSISMSFLGILQAACGKHICSFAVDRKDRAIAKEMVKFAKQAMLTAPKEELKFIDLTQKSEDEVVSSDLSPEEQLKQYKQQFIQGVISKDEYDAKKRLLKG